MLCWSWWPTLVWWESLCSQSSSGSRHLLSGMLASPRLPSLLSCPCIISDITIHSQWQWRWWWCSPWQCWWSCPAVDDILWRSPISQLLFLWWTSPWETVLISSLLYLEVQVISSELAYNRWKLKLIFFSSSYLIFSISSRNCLSNMFLLQSSVSSSETNINNVCLLLLSVWMICSTIQYFVYTGSTYWPGVSCIRQYPWLLLHLLSSVLSNLLS